MNERRGTGRVSQRGARATRALACILAALTFPLIWVGGLVTTYDAGMAVPDWPSTYGHNLLLYPWQTWLAGPWDLMIEHGHRLLGSLVGMVSLILAATVWITGASRAVRIWSLVLVVGVIAQGVLGGLRVLQADPRLAQVHGCTGPVFFTMTLIMVWMTWPESLAKSSAQPLRVAGLGPGTPRQRALAWLVAGLAFGQLVLGSVLRHVTFATTMGTFRGAVVLHVVGAALIAWFAGRQYLMVRQEMPEVRSARWHVGGLELLVLAQVALGLSTWALRYGIPAWLAGGDVRWVNVAGSMTQSLTITAHVAVGSLILGLASLWAVRITWPTMVSWIPWMTLPWAAGSVRSEVWG